MHRVAAIALIDHQPLFLVGLATLFRRQKQYEVVATGSTPDQAVDVAHRFQPAVIVMDLNLERGGDLATIAAIHAVARNTKIIAYMAETDIDTPVRAFEAGVSGYVLKTSSEDDLLAAVQTVLNGGTFINPSYAVQIVGALRAAARLKAATHTVRLNAREQQIVQLLLRGSTNKEIADSLSISVKTVKHYMTALMQKLCARNRLEVVIAAQRLDGGRPDRSAEYDIHGVLAAAGTAPGRRVPVQT